MYVLYTVWFIVFLPLRGDQIFEFLVGNPKGGVYSKGRNNIGKNLWFQLRPVFFFNVFSSDKKISC